MFARSILLAAAALAVGASAPAPTGLTVVELFTSQGCSSCPPANANLAAVASRADVVALSFGVTYWDQLGWKDSFAQPAFTKRQWAYAAAFGRAQVATPQIVVNGRADVVGNRGRELDALITRLGPVAGPAIRFADGTVTIDAGARQPAADVWLARYDPRTIAVPVRAGENSGRTLPHRDVVRELIHLGAWSGPSERFTIPPAPTPLRTVVLVQQAHAGPILAAVRADASTT